MWLTAPNRLGIAAWQIGDSVWRIDASGGTSLSIGGNSVSLRHPDDQTLPALDEQFVRGDELHLSYPQTESLEFGYRVVIRPIEIADWSASSDRTVFERRSAFEWIVSVQTTLLDSHPTIDLVSDIDASKGLGASETLTLPATNSVAYRSKVDGASVAILLGGRDAPFTDFVAGETSTRLRLFGQFLEKGVIRRAQPWVLIDRSGEEISVATIEKAAEALASSPIPLN
ncbi:hypothetical protein LOC67_19860 [Stieleria sp. JC731]|uniref:hypothetical protein n=1 Tax=Pirellulaceae TaxID=2691357 RepID=UPI001E2FE018|nr:hypothetical protein [Stieleria sp. JC731]MCC9602813.1 hypothetical protein [Stieleria sp. JC731]